MGKLAGLLVFVVVLVGAIALTRYYTSRPEPPPKPPAAPAAAASPAAPSDERTEGSSAPVVFKPQSITLDFETGKSRTTLALERDASRPAPESVWVWTYFFTPDGERAYCAGEPVEVRQPFATGDRATITVTASAADCRAPSPALYAMYARVNVSTESAFAARLSERQISYDTASATPVVLQNARRGGR